VKCGEHENTKKPAENKSNCKKSEAKAKRSFLAEIMRWQTQRVEKERIQKQNVKENTSSFANVPSGKYKAIR